MRFALLMVIASTALAAEAQARCTVTLKADGNTAAVQRAMDLPGKRAPVVCLRPGTYKGARLIATRSCTLRAVGKGRVILDAGERGRVMTVMGKGAKVRLEGLTLTNGSAKHGGALAVTEPATVSVYDSWLTNNAARADGGAVYVTTGEVRLVRSRLSGNKAKRAGAVMVGPRAVVKLASTMISDNKSSAGDLDGPVVLTAGASLQVLSSTLVYNSGHGVFVEPAAAGAAPGKLRVQSSIIMGTPDALRVSRREAAAVQVSRSVLYGGIGFVALDLHSSRALPVFHLKDTERYRPTFGSPAIGIGECRDRDARRDVAGKRRPRRCTAGAVESTKQEIKKTLRARKKQRPKDPKQPWSYP